MMGRGRTTAAVALMAVLSGATALLSRAALGAEPTTLQCLTAYEDSVTLKKSHQLRAARAKLLTCSSESCPAEVRAECIARVPEIDASIPTVVFEAKDAAGTTLSAVKVKMDGELLAERLQGSALSLDPGEHTFTFEAAGRPSVEKRLLIFEGEKLRRQPVELAAIAAPKPVAPPPVALATSDLLEQPQPRPAAKPPLGSAKIVALVLGGVGVAATGVGVAYGLIAMSRRSEANAICPNDCSDHTGVEAWNRANSAGSISTGAFVIGAAGIASGVAVWLLAKPAPDGTAGSHISLWPGGLQVEGRW